MGFSLLQDLPLQIIITILTMLPVESLVALMHASKTWYSFIGSPEFMNYHYKKSISVGNKSILLGLRTLDQNSPNPFKMLPYREPYEIACMEGIYSCGMDIDHLQLIGSSGGLVCSTDLFKYGTKIHLWNPFIRKCRTITSSSIDAEQNFYDTTVLVLGFGYIPETNEHKVIRIAYVEDEEDDDSINYMDGDGDNLVMSEAGGGGSGSSGGGDKKKTATRVEVYSLSTNAWTEIPVQNFPWYMCDSFSRAFVNNCIHWMVFNQDDNKDDPMTLAFDLHNQVFKEWGLPRYNYNAAQHDELTVYKGLLSFLIAYPCQNHQWCLFHVMNEYGNSKSWSLSYRIHLNGIIHVPSFITKNDELVFAAGHGSKQLGLLNLVKNETRAFNVNHAQEEEEVLDMVPMIESLVLLEPKTKFMGIGWPSEE